MGRERIRKVALVTIWILAVAAAVIFRHVARLTTNLKLSVWLSDGRTAIYFITYIVWGILLRRHVVVRSVKRWLSAIVFLMLFWMIVRQIPKTKIPWYWDGEVYVPKDTEPVQVGNFTVEAEYLPIDTVYPTFNNGYSKVAKSGGWYYILTDGDVSEYSDEDGGLAYEGDVYFDFDVENIFGDEDGNLYALGNGGPLVRWGTEEDEVLLNYCVMVSLHPSGKKAVGWSYSNSITEYDFETGTNKERVIDPVEGINSVSVTKDYQAVCGYKESETLLNIYDNNWNEVMTISSTDTESGMLEGVSAFEQTQNGWVIFDSWMENVIFVGFDGAILKEVSYEELFGTLNWPYVNGTCMDEEGNVIVAITDQREATAFMSK